jgi:hypothetical protein
MVMRLPSEPCIQLGLPSFRTNHFAEVLCSTTHTGSAVVCTAGGKISSCPTRLKPLEADVKSATMEMPPKIAAHHRGMGGYRLSCSAEVVVCQFRKRVDGHMFHMRLLKVVQRSTRELFCTPLQDAIEVHIIVG